MSRKRKRLHHAYRRAHARYERRMLGRGWCTLTSEALTLAANLWQLYRWCDTKGPTARSFVWPRDTRIALAPADADDESGEPGCDGS